MTLMVIVARVLQSRSFFVVLQRTPAKCKECTANNTQQFQRCCSAHECFCGYFLFAVAVVVCLSNNNNHQPMDTVMLHQISRSNTERMFGYQ